MLLVLVCRLSHILARHSYHGFLPRPVNCQGLSKTRAEVGRTSDSSREFGLENLGRDEWSGCEAFEGNEGSPVPQLRLRSRLKLKLGVLFMSLGSRAIIEIRYETTLIP